MSNSVCTASEFPDESTNPKPITFGIDGKILACGVDTVVMSLSIIWKNDNFFKLLKQLKENAVAQEVPMPGVIEAGPHRWVFNLKPFGDGGYAWVLDSHDFHVQILNRLSPTSRPSALVTIRSATLWQLRVIEAVDKILMLLQAQGADVVTAKATQLDPCMDILLPESEWTPRLEDQAVTRAEWSQAFKKNGVFTGLWIGRGNIAARIYDKPYEIKTKSKKYWMYDIWGLKEVPEGGRIARVEFRIRREVLRELGIDSIWSGLNYARNLWGYCTESWLKFQDRPDLHHTQQHTLPWWLTVQRGFMGEQKAHPLIRAKTVAANKTQLTQQMLGQLSSLFALESDGDITPGGEIQIEEQLSKVIEGNALVGMNPGKFHERVRRKIAKYAQDTEKFKNAQAQRKALGLPVIDTPPEKTAAGKKGGAK